MAKGFPTQRAFEMILEERKAFCQLRIWQGWLRFDQQPATKWSPHHALALVEKGKKQGEPYQAEPIHTGAEAPWESLCDKKIVWVLAVRKCLMGYVPFNFSMFICFNRICFVIYLCWYLPVLFPNVRPLQSLWGKNTHVLCILHEKVTHPPCSFIVFIN